MLIFQKKGDAALSLPMLCYLCRFQSRERAECVVCTWKMQRKWGCSRCRCAATIALVLLLSGQCMALLPLNARAGSRPRITTFVSNRQPRKMSTAVPRIVVTSSDHACMLPILTSTATSAVAFQTKARQLTTPQHRLSTLPSPSSWTRIARASGASSGGGSAPEDPFRPKRPSISPTVINALVRVLFHDEDAAKAAALSSEQRSTREDWQLTDDERRVVDARVCGVVAGLTELRFMLATAVSR